MKKLFIAVMLLCLCMNNSSAQEVVRNGNTFSQVNKSTSHKADTLITSYVWQDSKGVKSPIIINKSTGRCYVWKTSKNNKRYKKYMDAEICQTICRELGIEYKSRNRK